MNAHLWSCLGSEVKREGLNVCFWNAALTLVDPTEHHTATFVCRLHSQQLDFICTAPHSSFCTICLGWRPSCFWNVLFFLKWFSGSPTEGLPEHSLSILSLSAFSALKAGYNIFPILLLPINSAPWHQLGSRPLTSWTCYCPFFWPQTSHGGEGVWSPEGATPSLSVICPYLLAVTMLQVSPSYWYPCPLMTGDIIEPLATYNFSHQKSPNRPLSL